MKAVIKWTLWQRRFNIVWWSIASFFLIFINMIFYPSFKDQAVQLQKSFENLPQTTVQFIGGSTDFFSPIGFLNSQIFFFMLPLLLGVLAIGLGSSLLAREEQNKTIESLLARPISRARLLLSKATAGFVILGTVTLISLITTLVTSRVVNIQVSMVNIVLATIACFLLVLSFGAIAFLFTATGRVRGSSIGIATAVGLGGYIINSLAGTVNWLKVPSKLLPFHYYQPEAILRGTYEWSNILFFLVITLGSGILAWLSFRRRDIR